MLLHLLNVRGIVESGKQAAVNLWVKRFHAAVKNFGELSYVAHRCNRDTSFAQGFRGAPCREDGDAKFVKRLGKGNDASFIGNREEGGFHDREDTAPKAEGY